MQLSRLRAAPIAIAFVVLVLVLSACVAGANPEVGAPPAAGILLGLSHGLISPITFLVSLFNDKVSIYEVHNDGNWYDSASCWAPGSCSAASSERASRPGGNGRVPR